jgi:hypothetical protein
MTTKTIIMVEDYKHKGQTLYEGNKYPLEVNEAEVLLDCGVAKEEGKDPAPRATKPTKIQPSKTTTKTSTK